MVTIRSLDGAIDCSARDHLHLRAANGSTSNANPGCPEVAARCGGAETLSTIFFA